MHIPKIHPHTGYNHVPASAIVRSGKGITQYTQYNTNTEQQRSNEPINNKKHSEEDWGAVILIVIVLVIIIGYVFSIVINIISKIRSIFHNIKRNQVMTDKELEKLMKLVVLRNNGALTEDEFERERQKITKGR